MATGTTVFSRVTVVAPKTRIDLALPADVSVADLLPMLLEKAFEATPDGGARHGGWCLARLGDAPLDPSRTLDSLGVVDGDLLQLRRNSDNPPPPLYDDVVDALADAEPGSYRPWTKETAARVGLTAGALAMVAAAAALLTADLSTPEFGLRSIMTHAIGTVLGLVIAAFATGIGSMVTRAYGASTTGTVMAAAGGLPMAFVSGASAVLLIPGADMRPAVLLGSAMVLIFSAISLMVIGAGIVTFIAAATVSAFATAAAAVATAVPVTDGTAGGAAAGAAAVGLAGNSLLPRITIQLAKLPLPHVPGSSEDLREDTHFPDYQLIEHRTGVAHQYMTGLIIGAGLTAALGAIASVAGPSPNPLSWPFAAVVAAVLLLRARSYANGSQAIALLMSGLLAALGVAVALIYQVTYLPVALSWTVPPLVLLGVAAVVFGVVFPNRRFSPVQRRTVDVLEAVLIALVLPLALGVMGLYTAVRDLNLNLF